MLGTWPSEELFAPRSPRAQRCEEEPASAQDSETKAGEMVVSEGPGSSARQALQRPPVAVGGGGGCRAHSSRQPHLMFFPLWVEPKTWTARLLIRLQKFSKEMF